MRTKDDCGSCHTGQHQAPRRLHFISSTFSRHRSSHSFSRSVIILLSPGSPPPLSPGFGLISCLLGCLSCLVVLPPRCLGYTLLCASTQRRGNSCFQNRWSIFSFAVAPQLLPWTRWIQVCVFLSLVTFSLSSVLIWFCLISVYVEDNEGKGKTFIRPIIYLLFLFWSNSVKFFPLK